MTPIAPHIADFLNERLPHERRASENTRESYTYAFQLLFVFASAQLNVAPCELRFEQIDAPLIIAFYIIWKPTAVIRRVPETSDWRRSNPSCVTCNTACHPPWSRSNAP